MASAEVRPEPPLIVIAGPTASGKTAVAIDLAQQLGGEIICADSRTVYKDMNIGTAKPTAREQSAVRHWGIDLVSPDEHFSVADFQRYTYERIADIRSRGKVPFLVGGTGLYIDSVLFQYDFRNDTGNVEFDQHRFDGYSIRELQEYCEKNNIELPENASNKRYVIRAIERGGVNRKRQQLILSNTIVVGISTDSETLRSRIHTRAEQLFKEGIVDEAIMLGKKYGWNHESMTGNIYNLVQLSIQENWSTSYLVQKFITSDQQLAKRQMTWFRRNPYIEWCMLANTREYIVRRLADEQEL